MILKECMLIKNDVYVTSLPIQGNPTGIVVHSTGANNTWLGRYVNPVEGQENYSEIIADLGKNVNGNHWNRSGVGACVHAFIGKNDAGVIETYQTLPYDICCGGVARGTRIPAGTKYFKDESLSTYMGKTSEEILGYGWASTWAIKFKIGTVTYYAQYSSGLSYNYNPNARIQFEICEDNLTDETYFNAAMFEAQEYCAYICTLYGLSVSDICSHYEAYLDGYGSGHGDPDHWLTKFGKDMDWFRDQVQQIMSGGSGCNITYSTTEGTTISGPASVLKNAQCSFQIKPKSGKYIKSATAKANGTDISLTKQSDNSYSGSITITENTSIVAECIISDKSSWVTQVSVATTEEKAFSEWENVSSYTPPKHKDAGTYPFYLKVRYYDVDNELEIKKFPTDAEYYSYNQIINKRVLSAEFEESQRQFIYDGQPHVPVPTVNNVVEGESVTITVKTTNLLEEEVTPIQVGNYIASMSLTHQNYELNSTSSTSTFIFSIVEAT